MVKSRDGAELKLTVTDNPLFVAIAQSTMADIKPGMFVGSTGTMQPDGTQKAIEVHIFPESMRGTGEGHDDWDLKPQTKMTNGNVEQTVAGVDGPLLSVKYKDGEKKLVVTPETVVVTYVPGNKDDLKPGTRSSSAPRKSSLTARCRPRVSPTAETARDRHSAFDMASRIASRHNRQPLQRKQTSTGRILCVRSFR